MPDLTIPHNVAPIVPRIDEYFGTWSIHEPVFRQIVDRFQGLDLSAHARSPAALQAVQDQNETLYQVDQHGIATIAIRGATMKQASSLSGGTSTVRVRQQLRAAMNDPEVLGAMLVMDTPGGTTRGNSELAQAVANFAAAKPIYAFIEDMTASAGVAVASHATKRFANVPDALYGSMGTYAVLTDSSKKAEQLGVAVHVIRAGDFKGMGEPGTPITPEQITEIQRVVTAQNDEYIALIAQGLGVSQDKIRAVADGRIFTAQQAVSMGLIDGVQSYDATLSQLVAESKGRRTLAKRGKTTMSETANAATLAELKQSFPKSTAEWRETQLEKGATLVQAGIAYSACLEEQLAARDAAHAKAIDEIKQSAAPIKPIIAKGVGHLPLIPKQGEATEIDADPVDSFNALVKQFMGSRSGLDARFDAMARVRAKHPQLYAAYIAATNRSQNPKQQRIVAEKVYDLSQPVK